jgi:hypothetical protein
LTGTTRLLQSGSASLNSASAASSCSSVAAVEEENPLLTLCVNAGFALACVSRVCIVNLVGLGWIRSCCAKGVQGLGLRKIYLLILLLRKNRKRLKKVTSEEKIKRKLIFNEN